jgi:hypothetical protein
MSGRKKEAMETMTDCEHKFVFLRSTKSREYAGYQTIFERRDIFFCERCLEQKEVRRCDSSRGTPAWYAAE